MQLANLIRCFRSHIVVTRTQFKRQVNILCVTHLAKIEYTNFGHVYRLFEFDFCYIYIGLHSSLHIYTFKFFGIYVFFLLVCFSVGWSIHTKNTFYVMCGMNRNERKRTDVDEEEFLIECVIKSGHCDYLK